MDSLDQKDKESAPKPAETTQSASTVISDNYQRELQQAKIKEILLRAKKKFTDEEFLQATSILEVLLESFPGLKEAETLYETVRQAVVRRSKELFDEGVHQYMEANWDRAIAFWHKALQVVPNDENVLEWIAKAEKKKEQEKVIRAELLKDLEACGKLLSDRNYVVAEEHLESLKEKFTGGFRLADLKKIYESLLVRTRVELEKEFEDLRSNVVEMPKQVVIPKPGPNTQQKIKAAQLQKQYMTAFDAGKKHFDAHEWEKALSMWQTARQINPQDINLIHWIALAENNLIRGTAKAKPSPVRATVAFVSVFVLTAVISYLVYERYVDYSRETKNRRLIQLAIEHYRAGRLEESRKTLQIYVLQDPENESARTLLERITTEMAARQTVERSYSEALVYLGNAREQRKSQNYAAALESYQRVLEIDPTHGEARKEKEELKKIADSADTEGKIQLLLKDAERLLQQKQLDPAAEKLRQVLAFHPRHPLAEGLLSKVESERNQLNRIAAQLDVARYLQERNNKDGATLVLNRILADHPNQPQARQLLSSMRSASPVAKAAVEIRIRPSARLWIDGRDLGVSSYFRQMESLGTHILHIEQPGYRSQDLSVDVKSTGKNLFEFQLTPM